MEKMPKELLKEYVNSQNFTSTADIMEAMKEMFKDALQQVMNSKLDEKLGYEKIFVSNLNKIPKRKFGIKIEEVSKIEDFHERIF